MPDYGSFLQAMQPVDVGNVLARSAQIQGIRNNNLLATAQLDDLHRQEQFRGALANDPNANYNTLAAIDPSMAAQHQNVLTGMENNSLAQENQRSVTAERELGMRREKAQVLVNAFDQIEPLLAGPDPQKGLSMARYHLSKLQAEGMLPGVKIGDDPAKLLAGIQQMRPMAAAYLQPQESYGIVPNPEQYGFQSGTIVQRGPNGQLQVVQSPPKPGMGFEVLPDGTVRYSEGGASFSDVAGKVPAGFRLRDPKNPMAGVEPIPGGPQTPDAQATVDERKYAGYFNSMTSAERNLTASDFKPTIVDMQLFGVLADENASQPSKTTANKMLTPKARKFFQATQAWLDPLARARTGAAMPASEFLRYMNTHIPQAGDDPETLAQKAQQRQVEMQGVRGMGGRAMPAQQPQPQAPVPGEIVIDINGNPVQ